MIREFFRVFIIDFKRRNSLVLKCTLIFLPIMTICLIDSFNSEILKSIYAPCGFISLIIGLWWIRNAFKH